MKRSGFSLFELAIAVLIVGIITAAAAPTIYGTASEHAERSLVERLSRVRDAIDRYAVEHNQQWPGQEGTEASLKRDLEPYLDGPFPTCPVGARNSRVRVSIAAEPLSGETRPGQGWHYHNAKGLFIANTSAVARDGHTPYDQY